MRLHLAVLWERRPWGVRCLHCRDGPVHANAKLPLELICEIERVHRGDLIFDGRQFIESVRQLDGIGDLESVRHGASWPDDARF